MSVCNAYSGSLTSQQTISGCTSGQSITVVLCIFSYVSSTYGGAMYSTISGLNFYINQSFFSCCYATSGGGALYIYSAANEFITKCCFSNCTAVSSGQIMFLTSTTGGYHNIYQSSMTIGPSTTGTIYAVYLYMNQQIFSHCNESYCHLTQNSAIITYTSSNATITYTNFGSNNLSIVLDLYLSTQTVKLCNIFNNTESTSVKSMIWVNTVTVTFSNVAFIANSFTNFYYNVQSSYTYFNNCVFDTFSDGLITLHFSYASTLGLVMFGSYACKAQIARCGSSAMFTVSLYAMMKTTYAIAVKMLSVLCLSI